MNVIELLTLKTEKYRKMVLNEKNTQTKQKLKRSILRPSHCQSIWLRLLQVARLKSHNTSVVCADRQQVVAMLLPRLRRNVQKLHLDWKKTKSASDDVPVALI